MNVEAVLSGAARWCVVQGDCRDVLAAMPAKSVDHVITDPPYSERVHSKSRAGARKTPLRDGNGRITRCTIDREKDFGFVHLSDELRASVAHGSARVARRWTLAFCDVESSHLWSESLVDAGLDYCRTCAWVKVGGTPQFTGDRPGAGFEAAVVAHSKGRKRWNGGGSLGVWTHLTAIDRGSSGSAERVHPTQKPLSLMLELVELFTDEGDVIFDPFAGGGTTGVAALRLGRRFIGVELDAKHAASARERLEAAASGTTLRSARAGQATLFGGSK